MKTLFPALALLLLAACSMGPEPVAKLDAREEQQLAKALAGRTAGTPVNCVSTMNGRNLHAVGDHVLLYEAGRRTTYRNDLVGACRGLAFGDTLVMRVYSNEYCKGDIAHVVNLPSGMLTGTCSLGAFVPYTTEQASR